MIEHQLVMQHLKADPEDIEFELIEQYVASAVSICEGYCNRKFYATNTARIADRILALADLEMARDQRDTDLEVAGNDGDMWRMTMDGYIQALGNVRARYNGVLVDDTIRAAILLTVGHLYRNRQDVVMGQQGNAQMLPVGAQRILQPYLWIGDLA